MISNQILQSTIDGLKVISRIDLSVMDLEGNVLAATYPEAEEHHASVLSFVVRRRTARWCRATSFSRSLMKAAGIHPGGQGKQR